MKDCFRKNSRKLCRSNVGFTLLEMMLTVFLIGVSISLVVPRIGNDADDIAKLEARRFSALVSHLQDEATIVGLPMGVEMSVTENRYRFWQLEDGWSLVEKQQVLRERQVPDSIQLSFELLREKQEELSEETTELDEQQPKPVISVPDNLVVVEPNGLIDPFFAGFSGEEREFRVALDNELNAVVLERER